MTQPRINALWVTGNLCGGWSHSPLRDDRGGVRLLLQGVCVQLIAIPLDPRETLWMTRMAITPVETNA